MLSEIEQFYADNGYCGFGNSINVDRFEEYAKFVLSNIGQNEVFELGSGLGLAAFALKLKGIKVTATDIFPDNAIQKFQELQVEIPVKFINVNKIDIADNSVENYCLNQVMEHLENPEKAVNEVYRTLRPEGRFIIVGPNLISPLSSLKCVIYGVIQKWKTPWFIRRDGYSYPFGDTILDSVILLFLNILRTLLRICFKRSRKLIFRKPCLKKPALSDSDAVFLMNPLDVREMLTTAGFKILSYQSQRSFGSFAGSTWIVAVKA